MTSTLPSPWLVAADLFDPPTDGRLNRYVPHMPHPPQREFLRARALEALFGGAAGPGKTDALLMAALEYVDVPGYSAIIFRRISPDLHGADGLVERSQAWLAPVLGMRAWNGTHLTWTFPSGATLRLGHMQFEVDKLKFQGHAYQFLGWDELTHFTESQYRYLLSRLRKPSEGPLSQVPLRVRSASNPGGPGHEWVKRRLVDRLPDPDDPEDTPEVAAARVFIPARLADNPSIDQAAYRASLAGLEPEEREQLLDGNWDAREPGDWFFDDLSGPINYGKALEEQLQAGELPPPAGGVLDLGIDWGQSTHCLLGWPLEGGGYFVAREFVSYSDEPGAKTLRMLAMADDMPGNWKWGRAFFDAAGVQSMQTFISTAEKVLGYARPSAKSIPFGAQAPRTARTAKKSFKGVGCTYLRRLTRRASAGQRTQVLAVSPHCPVLLRQLKALRNDPEDPVGSWEKDEDQHGPDALVALVCTTANNHRVAIEEEAKNGRLARSA